MGKLENLGVLAKPEDLDITVEYISPSFIVKKPGGGTHLVTAFNGVARYTKPIAARVTSCDEVIHFLAQWKCMIKTDMTKHFYQLAMQRSSLKYLGIMTPFKGIRVYTRAAMGMPESSEHFDQFMLWCWVIC